MIYDGKQASIDMQTDLKDRVAKLSQAPSLAVFSIANHPSIASFIKIKKRYGESIGVQISLFDFPESIGEDAFIEELQKIISDTTYTGIIVQLPLPLGYNSTKIMNYIPEHLDVDVLGEKAWETFRLYHKPIPPVAGAVAYILKDSLADIQNKKIVIVGYGKLVGKPVETWFIHQGCTPYIVDIDTKEEIKKKVYKEADIVVSGIGKPHHLKPNYFKEGVILIDAGTSEQAGVLAGDFDPMCANIASMFTPVPGGVGPLTVAHLFKNIISLTAK